MAVKFETFFLPIFGLFQWYVMKRAGELIVMKRGGLVVSNFSHLSFVTTVSGVVKRVQKQTFSPCQRSLLHPRRREM